MIDYAARFADFCDAIVTMQRTSPYEVLTWYPYPDESDERLTELEEYIVESQGIPGFRIPSPMRSLYAVTGGWELSWVYNDPSPISNRPPRGQSTLLSTVRVFTTGDDYGVGDEAPYDKDYRPFDAIDDTEEVVLRFQRGVDEPMLYLHDVPSDLYHPLALDFIAYIDLLMQCRALSPWQRFFVTTPGYHIDDETTRVFFDNLAYLFPDADPAHFRR